MSDKRPYDLVLFGATGFTGALTAEYLARAQTARPLRWALAGRNLAKLAQVQKRLLSLAPGAPEVALIQADVNDEPSLRAMVAQTRVVISTVGPYIEYGETLVKACAELAADYVDLTGEPEFVDRITERYHERARASGVKIVNSCGFDSIPHDFGAYYTLQALRRRMSESEAASTPVRIEGFLRSRGQISGGTWHSAITAMGRYGEHKKLRRARSTKLPIVGAGRRVGEIPPRIGYRKPLGAWAVPMPTIDPQVVRRSARLLPEYGPDFRYGYYLALQELAHCGRARGRRSLGVRARAARAHAQPAAQGARPG